MFSFAIISWGFINILPQSNIQRRLIPLAYYQRNKLADICLSNITNVSNWFVCTLNYAVIFLISLKWLTVVLYTY